jgi:hypothetical protein
VVGSIACSVTPRFRYQDAPGAQSLSAIAQWLLALVKLDSNDRPVRPLLTPPGINNEPKNRQAEPPPAGL